MDSLVVDWVTIGVLLLIAAGKWAIFDRARRMKKADQARETNEIRGKEQHKLDQVYSSVFKNGLVSQISSNKSKIMIMDARIENICGEMDSLRKEMRAVSRALYIIEGRLGIRENRDNST